MDDYDLYPMADPNYIARIEAWDNEEAVNSALAHLEQNPTHDGQWMLVKLERWEDGYLDDSEDEKGTFHSVLVTEMVADYDAGYVQLVG